jgi:hypothetical protein
MGITQCFSQSEGVFGALPYFVALCVADWIRLDSRSRGRPIPHIAQSLIWYTWMPSVIVYMLWTRKFSGFGWLLLHAIGLAVVMFVSFYATLTLTYGQ